MSAEMEKIRTTHQHSLNKELWDLYKKQQSCFWIPEGDLVTDIKQLREMDKTWSSFIKFVSAFFAVSDFLVNVNLKDRLNYFADKYASKYEYEIQMNWRFAAMMEDIHSESYSIILEAYCQDKSEREYYIDAVKNFPTIKEKADFILNIKDNNNPYLILIACACVERIAFSCSFAAVFWFKSKNLLPGLVFYNSQIIRDEGIHCNILTSIFNILKADGEFELTPDMVVEINNIVRNICDIEKRFAKEALPDSAKLPNMNAKLMGEYAEYISDHLLAEVGLPPIYRTNNPFDFMDNISLETKTSFFETRNSSYQVAPSGGTFIDDDNI